MKLPSYPDYIPSGVEYLGKMPSAWQTIPVKREYEVQLGKMLQNEPESDADALVPYLKALHVLWGSVNTADLPEMWASPTEVRRFGVRRGDLLVCEGGEAGRAGMLDSAPDPCIIQNAVHRVRGRGADVRYLQYVLHAIGSGGWFGVLCNRATIAHLTGEKLAELRIPLPSLPEQRGIAAFLDCETAKLDTLVEKKRALIELLKEKRSALISRTVTRGLPPEAARATGLDPHPKLKPSSVEWIGEVPEHWEVWELSHAFRRIGSGTTPTSGDWWYYDDGTVPWVTTSELREAVILDTAAKVTRAALRDFPALRVYPKGTLLVAMYGATIARVGILGIEACVNQACCAFADPSALDTRFVFYWLQARRSEIIAFASGGGQPNVNAQVLCALRVPAPPVPEQHAIADFLDRETAKLDQMAAKVEEAVERLREHRAALITAAVTGKIDVRGADVRASL